MRKSVTQPDPTKLSLHKLQAVVRFTTGSVLMKDYHMELLRELERRQEDNV